LGSQALTLWTEPLAVAHQVGVSRVGRPM